MEEAVQDMKRAIELAPDYEPAKRNMQLILERKAVASLTPSPARRE
jgi:hypothetical protein